MIGSQVVQLRTETDKIVWPCVRQLAWRMMIATDLFCATGTVSAHSGRGAYSPLGQQPDTTAMQSALLPPRQNASLLTYAPCSLLHQRLRPHLYRPVNQMQVDAVRSLAGGCVTATDGKFIATRITDGVETLMHTKMLKVAKNMTVPHWSQIRLSSKNKSAIEYAWSLIVLASVGRACW